MKLVGHLCSLPVPDSHDSDIAMDFIGPLPIDNSFDDILTITDCLGYLFDHWYRKNGIKLKRSSTYHP
jgi:hypothetical protein